MMIEFSRERTTPWEILPDEDSTYVKAIRNLMDQAFVTEVIVTYSGRRFHYREVSDDKGEGKQT